MNKTKKLMVFWGVGLFIIIVDRITKWLIESSLHYHYIDVIKGFFRIVKARNTGIAFSLFSGEPNQIKQVILVGISLIAIYVLHLVVIRLKNPAPLFIVAFGLILGGAIGNLIDRVMYGYVIDFLDFYVGSYHWPAFNIADSAITTGAAILLIGILSKKLEVL